MILVLQPIREDVG